MELRHWVISLKVGHLLVNLRNECKVIDAILLNTMSYLSDDQPGQSHASDGADQLDCGPVVDVSILDCELLRLRLIIVNCKIGKSKLEMCV